MDAVLATLPHDILTFNDTRNAQFYVYPALELMDRFEFCPYHLDHFLVSLIVQYRVIIDDYRCFKECEEVDEDDVCQQKPCNYELARDTNLIRIV